MAIRLLSGLPEGGARTALSEGSLLWEPEIVAVPQERERRRLHAGTWTITLCALFFCVALVLPTMLVPLGYRVVVVMSGSMAPAAEPGDAFIVRKVDASHVRVGDVITFRPLRDNHWVTHRVTLRRYVVGELHFQTKGDANASTDPDLVPARNVVGRAVYDVPAIGRGYVFALSTIGRLALVVVPAIFLIAQELRITLRRRRKRSTAGFRFATVVLVAIACSAAVGPAAARFTDTVSANGNTFATGTLDPPTGVTATSGPISVACRVDLTWTAPGSGLAPDGYDIYRKQGAGAYALVKHVGTVTSTSDTDAALNPLTTYTYKMQSTRQSWKSGDSNQPQVTTVLCL